MWIMGDTSEVQKDDATTVHFIRNLTDRDIEVKDCGGYWITIPPGMTLQVETQTHKTEIRTIVSSPLPDPKP